MRVGRTATSCQKTGCCERRKGCRGEAITPHGQRSPDKTSTQIWSPLHRHAVDTFGRLRTAFRSRLKRPATRPAWASRGKFGLKKHAVANKDARSRQPWPLLKPCQVCRCEEWTLLANKKSTVMLSFKREAVVSVGQSSHISRGKQQLHTWVSVFSAALRSASISFSSAFVLRSWSPCSSSSCSVFAPTSLVSSANRRMLRVESSDCKSPA